MTLKEQINNLMYEVFGPKQEEIRIIPLNEEKEIIRRIKQNAYHNTESGRKIKRDNGLRRTRKKRETIDLFTEQEWEDKLLNTNGICSSCGKNVGILKLTMDHIIPICKVEEGHIYRINDVQPLCKSCNSRKGYK